MYKDDNIEDWDDTEELLNRYHHIRNGEPQGMLDEDEFELVIEYYVRNGQDNEAVLACDIAITYYPFSGDILILKAEILTQSQKYGQALKVLDELDTFDTNNLESVLLRSDIFLGQMKHDYAAQWLEKKLDSFVKCL